VKLKEKCEKLLEEASTRIKWNRKKYKEVFCDYVIKGKSFDQELEKSKNLCNFAPIFDECGKFDKVCCFGK
jgi:hypothetical protein